MPSRDTLPINAVFSPSFAAPMMMLDGEPPTDFLKDGMSVNGQPVFVAFRSIPARPDTSRSNC